MAGVHLKSKIKMQKSKLQQKMQIVLHFSSSVVLPFILNFALSFFTLIFEFCIGNQASTVFA
jgi:hypothetical protein